MSEMAIKVVVVGDEAVGKTSIILRYTKNRFTEDYKKTLGADFAVKELQYNGNLVKIYIWDIGAQEEYKNLHKFYFQEANLFIIVYDLTRPATFQNAKTIWLEEIRSEFPDMPVIFVGNKNDLPDQRKITKNEIKNELIDKNWSSVETSARTGENVKDLFLEILKKLDF